MNRLVNFYSNNFFLAILFCLFSVLAVRLYLLGDFAVSPFFIPQGGDRELYYSFACDIASFKKPAGYLTCLPLYPLLLGMIFIIFNTRALLAAIILNLFFESVTTIFIVSIVKIRYGRLAALFAGMLYGLLLPAAAYSLVSMPTSLIMCLTVFSVYLFVRWQGEEVEGKWSSKWHLMKQALVMGIILGAGTLLNGNFILALILVGFYFVFKARRIIPLSVRLLSAILVLSVGFTIFSFTGLLNKQCGGRWHLGTVHAGMNLYMGNNLQCNGYGTVDENVRISAREMTKDFLNLAAKRCGKNLDEIEANRYWQEESLIFWKEHPGAGLKLLWKKLVRIVSFKDFDDCGVVELVKEASPFCSRFLFVSFGLVEVLALPGFLLCFRRAKRKRTGEEVLLGISFVGSILFSFVTLRYRLPLVLILIPDAAATIVFFKESIFSIFRVREISNGVYGYRFFVIRIIVFISLLLMIFYPIKMPDVSLQRFVNYAAYWLRVGDITKAECYALEAIKANPSYAEGWLVAGNVYVTKKDFEKAYQSYMQAFKIYPDDERVLFNLGVVLNAMGKESEALNYFKLVLSNNPFHKKSWFYLAELYLKGKDFSNAEKAIRELKKVCGDSEQNAQEIAELEMKLKEIKDTLF
jgi:tetratricopeptide (TPR) repeat protein